MSVVVLVEMELMADAVAASGTKLGDVGVSLHCCYVYTNII